MTDRAVTDSVCLISLERIGSLHLLEGSFKEVLAPPAVAAEFGTSLDWLVVRPPSNAALVAALRLSVDAGEAEAIALAVESPGACLVLDDKRARRVAREMGVSILGTLGLLLRAKRLVVVPAVAPVLEQLQAAGFHMTVELQREVLRLAGEQRP